MPAGGGEAPTAGPGGPFDELMPHLEREQDGLQARYGKLMSADKMLRTTRGELDKLVKLGDVVTMDDIVEGAGQLVAAGLDPLAMASLLADVPSTGGPQALAEWLMGQDSQVKQREQQLDVVTRTIRHQMGVSAMRVLMGHAYAGAGAQPQMPAQQPNELAPGAEGASPNA